MSYLKTIVCFANSRKLSARCIAGREWNGKDFGSWIRPVTTLKTGEVGSQRFCVKGERLWDPQLLSILQIPLLQAAPSGCQTENHIIEKSERWELAGSITFNQALGAVERVDGPLWINGHSTSNGHNDEIPAAVAEKLPNSLMLIQPRTLEMISSIEGAAFGRPRRRVRGRFSIAGHDYIFMVTDPVIEAEFKAKAEGTRRIMSNPLLCLSISEVFESQNACYKLIAGVIESKGQ